MRPYTCQDPAAPWYGSGTAGDIVLNLAEAALPTLLVSIGFPDLCHTDPEICREIR